MGTLHRVQGLGPNAASTTPQFFGPRGRSSRTLSAIHNTQSLGGPSGIYKFYLFIYFFFIADVSLTSNSNMTAIRIFFFFFPWYIRQVVGESGDCAVS